MTAPADLRRATAVDIPALTALQRAAYARNRDILGVEPLPLRADYDAIFANYETWLAEESGALLGALILEPLQRKRHRPPSDARLPGLIQHDPGKRVVGLHAGQCVHGQPERGGRCVARDVEFVGRQLGECALEASGGEPMVSACEGRVWD